MMGVPVDGPANVYSGSKSVFKNIALQTSVELPAKVEKQT
jgi:hypothetical protein